MEFWQSLLLLSIVLIVPKLRRAFLFPEKISATRTKIAERLTFFDFAKGLAITAVIVIHSIYLFKEKFPDYPPYWIDSLNNMFRFAIGFFFISSGALLNSGLSKKKILRIFIPYVVVATVVGIFQQKPLDLIIGGVFRGDLLPPYYFIPVLFQFYLLYPLLEKFRNKRYFLPVSLIISYITYAIPGLTYIGGVHTFGPFLFLFAFGIANSQQLKANKPFNNISSWALIIPIYIGLQFMFPAHYYNSRFFYAPALFVVLHYLWYKFKALEKVKALQTLGQLSLWVYLIHFSAESFFVNLIPYGFDYSVFIYILLTTVLTTVVSGVGAKIITINRYGPRSV
ncbi:hypothetical protein A2803_01530 [Candidatus Woesebacteria bacterium RIFCSPHIGHO2_01_FULL_44_21]|uniref:Acyltransferase 3 domain-containing protein n=1 Tax=Candidatus Woesebacteria bacterium RIFCSPHIGHO2_01_FULL_44_21 TaxID=1802503 RepID=A0A1F7YZK6_9BACT|nr:MAG: hypothetical protein A2803_01530 [Candidatus Woesebacteria bacterium RIFCSPHIGHO2_01_FULL_44_21]